MSDVRLVALVDGAASYVAGTDPPNKTIDQI